MGAAEMQILGIVLIAVGVVVIAAAQILLSFWLKKSGGRPTCRRTVDEMCKLQL